MTKTYIVKRNVKTPSGNKINGKRVLMTGDKFTMPESPNAAVVLWLKDAVRFSIVREIATQETLPLPEDKTEDLPEAPVKEAAKPAKKSVFKKK